MWKYATLSFEWDRGTGTFVCREHAGKPIPAVLDEMGRDNWELVTVTEAGFADNPAAGAMPSTERLYSCWLWFKQPA